MRKICIILLLLPFSLFGQNCDTIRNVTNADSVIYCTTNVSCHTFSDGKIEVIPHPLSLSYYFSWNNGTPVLGDNTYDSLVAGSYQVFITTLTGAPVAFIPFSITEPHLLAVHDTIEHPTCYNDEDGSILITTYGDSPFTWSWSDGPSAESRINELGSGEYILTTTDSNGCSIKDTFNLIDPSKVTSTIFSDTLVCIDSCNGYAIVIADSGIAPYTFQWDDPLSQVNDTANNLCYGTYKVIVADSNGCLDTNEVFIHNPDTLKLSSIEIDNACFQICDGEISVEVDGGAWPYTYLWSLGGIVIDSVLPVINDLCPDIYSLTYTDANGCSNTTLFPLSERDSFRLTEIITPIDCYNNCTGEISVEVLDSNTHNPPFIFQWNNGDNTNIASDLCSSDSIILELRDSRGCMDTFYYSLLDPIQLSFDSIKVVDNICFGDSMGAIYTHIISGGTGNISFLWDGPGNFSDTTEEITDLFSGNYTLYIQDQNLCQKDTSISVSEPSLLLVLDSPKSPSCNGYYDGVIELFITGGTLPYNYIWSSGGILDTNIIDSLGADTYYYTVIDSNNCQYADSVVLTEPDIIDVITDSINNILCNGDSTGFIDLIINGGTPPYLYDWSNGDTTEDIINLLAGNYSLSMTDINGCSFLSLFNISEPLPLANGLSQGDLILCNGDATGSIDLTVNGGTLPYSYLWSNGDTTEDLTGLEAGMYSVTIIDSNGCTLDDSILLNEPDLIDITSSINNVLCNGDNTGSVDLNITGGIPLYIYNWSNGDTIKDIDSLFAGSYSVIVTDENGCTSSISLTVTEPDQLLTDIDRFNISCYGYNNGRIEIEVEGGVEPYTYIWTGPNSYNNNTISIDNLIPGTYILSIEDHNKCIISNTINITEPLEINISSFQIEDVNCNGDETGAIDLIINGGTPPYLYNWSNGDTDKDIDDQSSGNYTITIEDNNGCSLSETYFINQPDPFFETDIKITDIECYGESTGVIDITISGNTPPYNYIWSNSTSNSPYIFDLYSGDYDVVVKDVNNCEITFSYYISEPDELVIDYLVIPSSCEENNDGEIQTSINGGTLPYIYHWSNGSSTSNIYGLSKGNYTLQIEDANGCLSLQEDIEVNFEGLSGCVEIPSGFTPNGDGVHDEWSIYGLYNFADVTVTIYNRWGQEVFFSKGYNSRWDGKYEGKDLPIATYYYIIELPDSEKVFNGTVTIKR